MDILRLFGETTHKLSTWSQLLSISEFPFRVNLNLPVLLEDLVLCAIAKKYKQTPALVVLHYQIQRGVVVLAKSYNKKQIKENVQVMSWGCRQRGPKEYPSFFVSLSRLSLNQDKLPVLPHARMCCVCSW